MIWFTSDWHLGHDNIIKYCDRPFTSADEMDQALIANFNKLVDADDTTYFLGDFCFHKDVASWISRLKGYKIFIWGNHDKNQLFKSFPKEIVYEGFGVKVHMAHYPADSKPYYDLQLCGHVHEKWKHKGTIVNVGVDVWDFKPVNIKTLIRYNSQLRKNK
ncbi:MAG: hypothetical protein E2O29_01845 [Deltaproteobacteria bacterium]|nr:MAG: hypothetical protein E2O29_01845 [Deltaproteobacteria bacterium]